MSGRQASSYAEKPVHATIEEADGHAGTTLAHGRSGARRLHAVSSPDTGARHPHDDDAEARVTVRRLEEEAGFLRGQLGRWSTLLRDNFATIASDVDFDLRQRMQAVISTAEQAVEEGSSAKNRDAFMAWLDQRLAYETRKNYDVAVSSSREFSVRAAKHFALDECEVIDPPPPTIPSGLSATLATAPPMPGASPVSSNLNIFMRMYMGFVMFFLLTRFTGITLPLYFGVAPALLMGGLAFYEERKRQAERRRLNTLNTMRSHLTEFSLWATKESRDLIRVAEQGLRDGYSKRVERRQRELDAAIRRARKNRHDPAAEPNDAGRRTPGTRTGAGSSGSATPASAPDATPRTVPSSGWNRVTSFRT